MTQKKEQETNPNVYARIVSCAAEIAEQGISKDRKNTQQGYNFRGIDDVYNALAPIISKHGLVILPRVLSREQVERQTQKGGVLFYTTVEVEFDFVSALDHSKHTVKTYGEAMDSGDKSTNKAMSAAYKYACMQAFCIPTEGDNDADQTTHDVAPKKPEPKQEVKPVDGNEFLIMQNGIKAAKDMSELKAEWSKIAAAIKSGRMTDQQVKALEKEKDKRKLDLDDIPTQWDENGNPVK